MDLCDRHVLIVPGAGLRRHLGTGLHGRGRPARDQPGTGDRHAGDEQQGRDFPPSGHGHGREDSLGKDGGCPAEDGSRRTETDGCAGRGRDEMGGDQLREAARPEHADERCGRREAAPREPVAEPFPRPAEPALDRADGPAQVPRRLLVGAALQVAEDDRDAEPLRQPVDLLVEQPAEAVVGCGACRGGRPGGGSLVPGPARCR